MIDASRQGWKKKVKKRTEWAESERWKGMWIDRGGWRTNEQTLREHEQEDEQEDEQEGEQEDEQEDEQDEQGNNQKERTEKGTRSAWN